MAGVDPRFDPEFQRGYDPVQHGAPKRAAPARASGPVAEVVTADELDDVVDERPNPWMLTLLLASVLFLVVAGAMLWAAALRDPYSGSTFPDPAETLVQQLAYLLPSALIIAGILGIVLWVAVGAIRAARA